MEQTKIGALIAKLRKERNLTQSELGEQLGVSYKAISKWERGINMPDASLYKPLCDILGITIDELIAGESKKSKNNKKLIIIIVMILLMIILGIIIYNPKDKQKYPKITIDNIEIKSNNKHNLVNQLLYTNDNIWYYSLDEVKVCTYIKTCYDLGTALNHKQITVNELKDYLNNSYLFNNTKRYILYDGGTTIFENNNYTIIFCNTINNKDIYFGPQNLVKILDGNYCGHSNSKIKYFTRTYKILNIYPDDDEAYMNVTLSMFQAGIETVRISKEHKLEVGKTYEFTFYTYKVFDDTIRNVFNESTLTEVKETDKVGLSERQDPIIKSD